MLDVYLPDDAPIELCSVEISTESTPISVIDRFEVPGHLVHLVYVNSSLLERSQWGRHRLVDGDSIDVWPLLAGG